MQVKHEYTYISGPMTGMPRYNVDAFFAAADRLRAAGRVPLNPAAIWTGGTPNEALKEQQRLVDIGFTHSDFLRADLAELLMHCGSIYMLPGWEKSKGARLELMVAVALGMEVVVLEGDE